MEATPGRPFRADVERLRAVAVRRHFGFTSYDPGWLAALGRTVGTLRSTGANVLVLGPVPDPHSWMPTCLSAHLDAATACAPARSAAVNGPGVAAEAAAVQQAGGRYDDLTDLFRPPAVCPVVVGNPLVIRDDNHVAGVRHGARAGGRRAAHAGADRRVNRRSSSR